MISQVDSKEIETEKEIELHYKPQDLSYGDHLSLEKILNAQNPLSPCHDEMLFIIQHQVSELWIKLLLHELNSTIHMVRIGNLDLALKMCARISCILEQLLQAWSVLATLTPSEFAKIRPFLLSASGLQSHQYRMLEFILGNKNPKALNIHSNRPEIHVQLKHYLEAPSLYDEVIRMLAKRGLPIDPKRLSHLSQECTQHNQSVEDAWHTIYSAPHIHWDLYHMGEKLMDIEDGFRQWRFRHATTVERIIGFKRGTGGTSGINYLQKRLEVVLFPELWHLRTVL